MPREQLIVHHKNRITASSSNIAYDGHELLCTYQEQAHETQEAPLNASSSMETPLF